MEAQDDHFSDSQVTLSRFDTMTNQEHLLCSCDEAHDYRWLTQDSGNGTAVRENKDDGETWEIIYMCMVLLFMFVALMSDRVGADFVMLIALTLCMAAEIVTIEEGLAGFANEGLLTVLVLFVVAAGISVTGALDWYMGKLLGRPKTTSSAQLRLMIPIAFVSAFLNNTPVVVVMIPIVQKWGKNIGVNPQQLLIPLSFASILGGTCTLIGTSTNLVVEGLLSERYPNDPRVDIGLFDLGVYGVPVAIAGTAYILLASPLLLPGGSANKGEAGDVPLDNSEEDILLGARLTMWSSAAGRSVKRSGLRDTGGLYLVSVHRAATGHVHRAVGQEFVLNVGDILYFTGKVEGFGEFCEEHGLEVVTNEVENTIPDESSLVADGDASGEKKTVQFAEAETYFPDGVDQDAGTNDLEMGDLLGTTKESLSQSDHAERLRSIHRMTDLIRGIPIAEPDAQDLLVGAPSKRRRSPALSVAPQIVVTTEDSLVVVGVDAKDRAGLLMDISKGLLRLELQLHHTEAAVVDGRSLSIWRCEVMAKKSMPDKEEVWSVLNALLEAESGIEAVKKRGLRVIRAVVTRSSRLVGRTAAEVGFRNTYKAAIVAVQRNGKNSTDPLSSVRFNAGDVLVLQTSDDSPLLVKPPDDFYKKTEAKGEDNIPSIPSVKSFVNLFKRRSSQVEAKGDDRDEKGSEQKRVPVFIPNDPGDDPDNGFGFFVEEEEQKPSSASPETGEKPEELDNENFQYFDVWGDLRVLSEADGQNSEESGEREFLISMEVVPRSQLTKKTVIQLGLDKLPGVFLVSIERPIAEEDSSHKKPHGMITITSDALSSTGSLSLMHSKPTYTPITPREVLQGHDVLWFAGSAGPLGDLRKIPGLRSYESEEVRKINEKVHDRRLVQAVVARKGPLVGKTVVDVRFRTRYGAAVIAIHRDGSRIHDHPGQIKLQAGDVLLLEAGPTFIERNAENNRSFALLSEVQDSAPPRLRYLLPSLALAVAMLAVFTAGVASLLVCALFAAILMVAFGILSQQEARDAINWDVYITIACAFGIGSALTNSGLANEIAVFLVNVGEAVGIGDAGLFGAVYIATFLISNVVTNNAAAALTFPIALDAAEQAGVDILLMSYCLMLGASASFMSPYGYTTNLLIYGPGGYKYKDFLVIGTPMQVVLCLLTVALLSQGSSNWYFSWIISSVVLVLIAAARMSSGSLASLIPRRTKPETDSTP